jgi:hypothetical protein
MGARIKKIRRELAEERSYEAVLGQHLLRMKVPLWVRLSRRLFPKTYLAWFRSYLDDSGKAAKTAIKKTAHYIAGMEGK